MTTTHDTDRGVAAPSDATPTPPKNHTRLIIIAISSVVAILLVIAARFLFFHEARVMIAPTPGVNPGAPATAAPATTAPSSNVFSLPPESINDDPTAVVNYMDGSDGIFLRMFKSDNTDYLLHYYNSTSQLGYSRTLGYLQQGIHVYQITLSNINAGSTAPGTIVASFDEVADFHGGEHHVTTYKWNYSTNEWNVWESTSTSLSN
jgi:hypothetical protein